MVRDHYGAIRRVLESGSAVEGYNVGGWNETPDLDVVRTLCAVLDTKSLRADGRATPRRLPS
jgi:dTDP-glucose 4,6-dehydratase